MIQGLKMNDIKSEDTVQKILEDKSIRLDELLKSQQLMLTNISHEIRTSLNAVAGYLSLIDEKNILTIEDKNYLDKANYATSTLKTLVSDILNVSKINTGQMEIKEESFWLDEMILKCVDSVMLGINKKKIMFKIEADILSHKLIGDHHHMVGIVVNLLSNAVKYTDSGFVHLIVKKYEDEKGNIKILFRVKDSGIGMTEEQTKQIFDPYIRFEIQREGLGLGLHIASKLADKLGGNLTVKSKPEEGSTFDFTVTLKQDSNSVVSMHNKVLCFFNNTKEIKVFEQKLDFLKQFGAKVIYFNDEEAFIDHLLNVKDKPLDIVSITTSHEVYAKYDALIHYLKNIPKFKKTHFIAEGTESRISLNYFDDIYERITPVSAYIDALKLLDKQQNESDIFIDKQIHILAVDDIATNLEILNLLIKNRCPHATLDLAMGGYEAIGMYKTKTYDIIFMDLKMPGLNGFEVFEKMKAIKDTPPVYALTADVYKDTYDRVMYTGFKGLLEKPLQLDLMFETIKEVLNEKYN